MLSRQQKVTSGDKWPGRGCVLRSSLLRRLGRSLPPLPRSPARPGPLPRALRLNLDARVSAWQGLPPPALLARPARMRVLQCTGSCRSGQFQETARLISGCKLEPTCTCISIQVQSQGSHVLSSCVHLCSCMRVCRSGGRAKLFPRLTC